MNKHLILASYDGISTHYCGVGATLQDTILALKKNKKSKVSLAYVSADPRGAVFDDQTFKNSIDLVKSSGGYLIPLSNGTMGKTDYDMWQSFPQWEYLCASLASVLNTILSPDEDNVLMLHDTPFLLFQKFKQQIFDKPLKCFYMPRSSGVNHKFGDETWRQERIKIEKEAFQSISSDSRSRVLAIGDNFGKHLQDEYGLSFGEDDYIRNGLCFSRFSNYLSKKYEVKDLKKFGIKIDSESKIIFSWGRASVAKGLKELLEAWKRIVDLLPNHYMIVQAPNNSGEDSYFESLKIIEREVPRTIVINDFNPDIWKTILRLKNTNVVCIPSLMDPNPHTPIEAKLFSLDMDYVIVSSDMDGVKDTFYNNECLWADPRDIDSFANKLIDATKISKKERLRFRNSNSISISKYNYEKTIQNFLKVINFL